MNIPEFLMKRFDHDLFVALSTPPWTEGAISGEQAVREHDLKKWVLDDSMADDGPWQPASYPGLVILLKMYANHPDFDPSWQSLIA
jgi:hypothetical protein